MRKALLNSIVPLLFIGSLIGIYSYKQSITYKPEEVVELSAVYKKVSLKKDRQYPLRLYVQNDVNTYVLKKNAYKAWNKHAFLENVKVGDSIYIGIDKKVYNIVHGSKKYLVKMITLGSAKRSYLNLEDYNTFQKAGAVKLYVFSTFLFLAYLLIRYFKFESYRIG